MRPILPPFIIVPALAIVLAAVSPATETPDRPAHPAAARLEQALSELARWRETVAEEKLPLARELSRVENEQIASRAEYEAVRRRLDQRALDLNNLRQEIKRLEQEQVYLTNLFTEYARNFETRLHIAEMRTYESVITAAKSAVEQTDLPVVRRFARQSSLLEAALRRLGELGGGVTFEGRAAGGDGSLVPGRFVLIGPAAYFAAATAPLAGIVEQRLGSLEPTVAPYLNPEHERMTREFVMMGEGLIPLDTTLGGARKIEATRESLAEHIRKGGPVMVPILSLAGLVALLALIKAVSLLSVRIPRAAQVAGLLDAVRRGETASACAQAEQLRGVAGQMLRAGAAHLGKSKEIIEEAMYEQMLAIRFRFNRGLPFIAVGAACAPLLGLLGTVTGIIATFKLITVFGSGDVKMLSSGISEALITTEFGLLIAIPSLLIHAFLSRKSRALLDRLEQLAVSFLGAVAGAPVMSEEAVGGEVLTLDETVTATAGETNG